MNKRICGLLILVLGVLLLCAACDDMLEAEKPIYEKFVNKMSIIGDATPGAWDLDLVTMMTNIGGKTYRWEGFLTTGELKFAWQKPDFLSGSWYMATTQGLAVEKDVPYDMVYVNMGLAENNWRITEAGGYRITLDLFAKTVVFEEGSGVMDTFAAIYIIGAATPGVWALENATPMVKGADDTWTWTGTLTAANASAGGGLKFICKKNAGDTLNFTSSPEFRTKVDGTTPTGGEQELAYFSTGATVNNFNFSITTAGTYTITLYPYRLRVIIATN